MRLPLDPTDGSIIHIITSYREFVMDTLFAPAERATSEQLAYEIELVGGSQVLTMLLQSVGGLVAVVNELRQVLAVNTLFLNLLGITNPDKVLGLRPGEVIQCIHAHEKPSGCGTTKYCTTCGAAIAMVTSAATHTTDQRICTLSIMHNGIPSDMVLEVRAHPLQIKDEWFILLFLRDITREERYAALERTFFHDISNTVNMLIGTSDLLSNEFPGKLSNMINRISLRLVNEITLQRCLTRNHGAEYTPFLKLCLLENLFDDLESAVNGHPSAQGKCVEIERAEAHSTISTDHTLCMRVLNNMVINALEASAENECVRVWVTRESTGVTFHVWNSGYIREEIAVKVFQRYFSTKGSSGRGIGTYSMRLFGEEYLGGKVDFSTSESGGTEFRLSLPQG